MKIFVISDTHGFHNQLIIPDNIDMIIFAGDGSNSKSPSINANELIDFLDWYEKISNIKYKIFVAGNHETSIEKKLINRFNITNRGIIYLEHESIVIEGINIFGSPYTPYFCDWAFNVQRHKLDEYWKEIPDNTNILVTHGPPKYILDLSKDRDGKLEFCGDKSLLNRVKKLKECKYNIFGHIHNSDECYNKGFRKLDDCNTTFINASCVTDARFDLGLTSHGFVIEY